jgi:7-keto-8-aminopelargonate synthetase-like enzyme
MFSMDGDLADVHAIASLCRQHDAAWILDEAHALGVRGPEGRGVAAEVGVVPDVVIGTFGKALGSFGAFAATTPAVAQLLWNRARTFVFTTGLPPSVVAASRRAIEIVRGVEGSERRRALSNHARRLRVLVPNLGGVDDGAIAPLVVGEDGAVMRLSERLFDDGVFVQGIRPPTIPAGTARLRVSLTSAHTNEMVERAGRLLASCDSDKRTE